MKNFRIYGVSALLGLTLAFGVTSCSSDDPATDDKKIEVPAVKAMYTITGMVSDRAGEPIKGATVTMGTSTVTTGEDGFYNFDDVKAGTNSITVTKEGKISDTQTFEIKETTTGSNTVVNFTLSNEGVTLVKQDDGSSKAETETETLKGNDAATIPMEVVAPADAVDDAEAVISVTPVYSEDEAKTTKAGTRASDELFLAGTDLSCNKPNAKIKNGIELYYTIDPSLVRNAKPKKLVNGKWEEITNNISRNESTGKMKLIVKEFGTYALFYEGSMSAVDGSEDLIFTQNTWDNTLGSSAITVDKAEYTYKVGCDVAAQTDKIKAYLVEMIVRAVGAGITTATGYYPINISLPAGGGLQISGTQDYATITASMGNKSVTAKHYNSVTIFTTSWTLNREHTGGGSK